METVGKVLTASDLLSGEVVYQTAGGNWSPDLSIARYFAQTAQAEAHLAEAGKDHTVIGPYLSNAALNAQKTPIPVHFREGFRARGPSNRFLGKQATTPQILDAQNV